jgi:hypothetical protein
MLVPQNVTYFRDVLDRKYETRWVFYVVEAAGKQNFSIPFYGITHILACSCLGSISFIGFYFVRKRIEVTD